MNEKGFEFSFTWLFALFVGAVVIFLAIYSSSQFIQTSSTEYNSKVAAQLGIVFNPIETGIESGKSYPIVFPDDTRLNVNCDSAGFFGEQTLSTQVRNRIGEPWKATGIPYKASNKYLFLNQGIEGKEFYIIAKPFNFPYKVGDVMVMLNKKYCFVGAPEEIEEDVLSLNVPLINVSSQTRNCPVGSTSVCFGSTGCNISVFFDDDNFGRVVQQKKTVYFYGNLLYPAIFSNGELYDCQVERLKKRTAELASLYSSKEEIVEFAGCPTSLGAELTLYADHLGSKETSLSSLAFESESLEESNDRLSCPLF